MHVERKPLPDWLRLPLEAALDLTYRCNNDCRHCWLQLPAASPRRSEELTTDEIRRIADESRALGCRRWALSGGEPMLRPDFAEIFAFLTDRSAGYSLNTNGTLITPAIARLMVRKGRKMVALYGATADVHDHVTRAPGSYEATLRGMAYLREAGAGFIVQIVPMRDNWHQYQDMVKLARTRGSGLAVHVGRPLARSQRGHCPPALDPRRGSPARSAGHSVDGRARGRVWWMRGPGRRAV